MGKQTAVAMTSEDEQSFLKFLRSTADVQIFRSGAPTVSELWLDDFTESDWCYQIWNKEFPFIPDFGTVTMGIPESRGWRYIKNIHNAPVLEYSRCDFQQAAFRGGRLYWSKYFSAPDGLNYDVVAFDKWYSKIIRWVHSHGTKVPDGSRCVYFLPGAWTRFAEFGA